MRARGQEPMELPPVAGLRGQESLRMGLLTLSAGFHPSQLLGFGGECVLVYKVGLWRGPFIIICPCFT